MTKTLKIVNGDVVLTRTQGRLVMITDLEKARQSLARMLSLDAPSGAGLDALLTGEPPDSEFALAAKAQRQVRRAFDALVRAQRNGQLSSRTPAERLGSIKRMYVVPANFGGGNSATGYAMKVEAVNVAGNQIAGGVGMVSPGG